MKTKIEKLEAIYESYMNGQIKQMAEQMEEYGMYDVLSDYFDFLTTLYATNVANEYTKAAAIYYNRVKYR